MFRRTDRTQIEGGHRIYGVVVGIVTDNKDPDGKYRVKVRFPWLPNGDESGSSSEQSHWLRVCTMMAGNGMGFYCLPEVENEVLVAFEHGDASSGYVIGSLWNKNDASIMDNKGGKNEKRSWHTRAGHKIEIYDPKDNAGEGSINIQTKSGAKVYIDDKDEKIEIFDKTGGNTIQIDGKNKTLNIKTADKINMKCDGDFKIECDNLEIKAKKNIKIEADKNIDIKAGSALKVESGQTSDYKAGGTLTVKGGPKVDINP
jgi:uncharacterized protein involved in type VI secretion and phage assembly